MESWLARLRKSGRTLPEELRAEILAVGGDAVPALIEVLLDPSLLDQEDGEQDSPPTHAAGLLAQMRATEAIEPMIRAHARYTSVALSEKLGDAYPALGVLVVEPALRLVSDENPDVSEMALSVLAESRSGDDRALEALLAAFARDRCAAGLLVTFGDRRALPAIERVVKEFGPRAEFADGAFDSDPFGSVVRAYEKLGGAMSDELRRRRIQADFDRKVGMWMMAVSSEEKVAADRAAGRSPGERFIEWAAPLFDVLPGVSYEVGLEAAFGIFQHAVVRDPRGDEGRVESMVARMPAESAETFRQALTLMFRRHRLCFPELAPKGTENPEKKLIEQVLEDAAPDLAKLVVEAQLQGLQRHEIALLIEMTKDGDYDMASLSRTAATKVLEEYPGLRENLRSTLVASIQDSNGGIPAVVIAKLGNGVLVAGVVSLGSDGLH